MTSDSNAPRIVGIVGFFHFLAFTFVSLRIYVRGFMIKALGIDDALIVLTTLLALSSWICLVLQIPYGLGRHATEISVEDRTKFERITFWKTVLSDGFAMGFLRISMAISLLRLKRDLKWYKWSLYGIMGFVVLYSMQAIIWLFLYCTPFSGWWEFQWSNPYDPRCRSFTIFLDLTYWNISCNIITDVCLGALPVPVIWKLKMPLRVRLYVIGILNLGYCAVLMGILKAIFMLATGGDLDTTSAYWVHFWENLQLNIGITAACASFLKPLVGRILKLNSSAVYSGSNRYMNSSRTPGGRSVNNAYAFSKKKMDDIDNSPHGEFQRFSKNDIHVLDARITPVDTKCEVGTTHQTSHDGSSSDAVNTYGMTSDANSEEIMLRDVEPAQGIILTRDVSVKYSIN